MYKHEVAKIKIFNESSNDLPFYAKEGDAGMDIMSSVCIEIQPGETLLVKTGLYMGIPSGWEVQVRPRSGMSLKTKMRIANSVGTIDHNYKGEVCIIVDNIGKTSTTITVGERIAQILAKRVPTIEWEEVDSKELLGDSVRGTLGFGSSGTH